MKKAAAQGKSIWKSSGVKPKVKRKGIRLGVTKSGAGVLRYRVTNTFTNTNEVFATREDAVRRYDEIVAQLDQEGQNFGLTPSERAALALWRNYRERRIREGKFTMTLEAAIQIAMEQEEQNDISSPLLAEAVREFINHLENEQREPAHIRTTRRRLELALACFPKGTRLHSIGEREATDCLLHVQATASQKHGKPISATTFKGYEVALSALWNWNIFRSRISKNPFPAAYKGIGRSVTPDRLKPKKEYTTPASLAAMLNWTLENQPHMLPALAVIAFCGLRPMEAHRLKWGHITFDNERGSAVHVGEDGKTKTGIARMVNLCPCAVAWIETAWQRIGKPSEYSHIIPARDDDDSETGEQARSEAWGRLIDLIKTNCPPELKPKAGADAWPRDLLRHSFGTYYRAKVGSLTQTADQMGNSVAVCNKHYSRPVLQAEGEAYFNIWPDGKKQG